MFSYAHPHCALPAHARFRPPPPSAGSKAADLATAVRLVKPSVLVGCSTSGSPPFKFTEEVRVWEDQIRMDEVRRPFEERKGAPTGMAHLILPWSRSHFCWPSDRAHIIVHAMHM